MILMSLTTTIAACQTNDNGNTLFQGEHTHEPIVCVDGSAADAGRAAGVELSGNWQAAPAWRLSAAVGGERISYETFLGEGNMYSTQVGLAHAVGRATLLRADGVFRRAAVERDAYSWREFIIGASATRELPKGFVATVGSTYRLRRYDSPIAAFGPEALQDRTLARRMKISNRHIELFGFMPEFTVKHERRSSNLSLYDYKRNLVEVGVVRTF